MQPGTPLPYLAEVADELRAEGQDLRLSLALSDRLLIARLALEDAPDTSWDYLIGAWVRCKRVESTLGRASGTPDPVRAAATLAHTRGLLTSYAGLVLDMPDMFPRHEKASAVLGPAALVPTLLQLAVGATLGDDSEAPPTLDWAAVPHALAPAFISDFVARFAGDGLDELLGCAMHALTQGVLRGKTVEEAASAAPAADAPAAAPDPSDVHGLLAQMLGVSETRPRAEPEGMTIADLDWRPIQLAVAVALEHKGLAAAVPFFASFCPDVPAPALERMSLLGPLLRLSCFSDAYPSIARDSFCDARTRSPVELDGSMQSLRMALDVLQTNNFRIWNALVRAGAAPRERVLAFWAHVCALNAKRGAMQVRAREVASDAFMVNLYDVVLRFAEPFAEPTCAKIDRVDATYLRHCRWDTRALTRIHASESEAAAWLDAGDAAPAPAHFITEVFFVATRLNTLALGKAMRRVEHREKEMDRLQKRMDELEAERSAWQAMPHAASVEQLITRARAQSDRLYSEVLAAQTQLLAPAFVQRVVALVAFTMTWLVRVADPRGAHPHTPVALPLPPTIPDTFRMLPEHLFEDVCEITLFYSRHKPDVLDAPACEAIVTFCTVFLSSGWFIRNPFLKAKLAEMLSYNVVPYGALPMGVLGDTINAHPLALQHLVPALMAFWIAAESTGSHTQFYDKFNIRYHLTQVFKAIWANPDHKAQLYAQARDRASEFVVFINRLMNDVTFLLDDALDKLTELHVKQVEMDDPLWLERPAEERAERDGIMRSLHAQIRSDLALGHEFLRLLIKFTAETSSAFMTPEIVDRLAAMLDYNLDVLVGPRCQELKVKDPKLVGFDPKSLLSEILSVFLNLARHAEFAAAIARDGRSYSRETFSKAASISQRHMLKSPADIDILAALVNEVERVRQEEADEEEDLGEIPDDFLDPLLATIMRDPVRLPSSRAVIDRSSIKAHLLSDGTDPFNRQPLKLEDVQPDDELREKIQAWIAERKAAVQREKKED